MNRTNEPRSARDDDRALCVAYIDGLLSQDEQLAFEQRLAADPELAEGVRRLLETDELLRDAQREMQRETQRAARRRPVTWIVSLAAAAALLAWLAVTLLRAPDRASFEVALAPSFEAARDYVAATPALEGLVPPGLDALRGGAAETNVDAARFVTMADEAETRAAKAALAVARSELAAPFFVLPIHLSAASEVVVVGIVAGSAPQLLYPEEDGPFALLAEGTHVLPAERFERVGDGDSARVRYRRGFLMPLGTDELHVVVGVREVRASADSNPIGLDLLPARDVSTLEAALELGGFEARTMVVRQPR